MLPQANFPLCLAPMVGLTHVSFRRVVRRYLPDGARTQWPTEMLNSRRLPGEKLSQTPETLRDIDEENLVPQLLGNEERPIAESIERLTEWGAAGVDINMGCPVRKALRHNYGVALMGNPEYAAKVVRLAVKHSSVPVSVKLRAGLNMKNCQLVDFVKRLEDAGAAWITLHPRFAHEKRRGVADWDKITLVRRELSLPVIGNGDIQNLEHVLVRLGSERLPVMVGRALTARPWLFWQLGEHFGYPPPKMFPGRTAPRSPEEEGQEYGRVLRLLFKEMQKDFLTPSLVLRKFRFYVRTSSPWLFHGHTLLSKVLGTSDLDELSDFLEQFFSRPQRMSSETQLR